MVVFLSSYQSVADFINIFGAEMAQMKKKGSVVLAENFDYNTMMTSLQRAPTMSNSCLDR